MNDSKKSLLFLHISVMLFGLSGVIGQFVDAPSVVVAGGRVVCSSLLLLVLCLVSRTPLALRSARDYGLVLFTGVVMAIHWTTFFQAIQVSSVAIGTITFSTFPLFLTFLEPLLFHEKIRGRNILGAAVLLIGVLITIPSFSMENQVTIGVLWGMLSSFCYAIMTLSNRYLSSAYPGKTLCLYEQGTAAVVLLPALLLVEVNWTVQTAAGIAVIGFICTTFAYSLYVAAQKNVKAQTAGMISGMETVYGIVYAWIFLGEVPGIRELIGGAIILGVALLFSVQKSQAAPSPAQK